jgi:hypothetical protein
MLVRPARGIDRADPPDAEVGPRPSRGAGPTAGCVDLVADRRAASVVEPGHQTGDPVLRRRRLPLAGRGPYES